MIFKSETQQEERTVLFQIAMPKLVAACTVLVSRHESLRSLFYILLYLLYLLYYIDYITLIIIHLYIY